MTASFWSLPTLAPSSLRVWHYCSLVLRYFRLIHAHVFRYGNDRALITVYYPMNNRQDIVSQWNHIYELSSENFHDKCYSYHLNSTTPVCQVPYEAVLLVDYDLLGRSDARTAFSEIFHAHPEPLSKPS
ncbi:uncharacterized protein FOMMEDRAFT_151475 [Fomitiporia mediterranea MF3/22]|uniref:uncharacterized protein n=1 Tax=Fomitiporia mediterranea (strain MF3/22) TaxID=694068 RepID=UPI000440808C|nr:uncharacterized protein FOMMEDRAFT_151475 [Fomitiporia mediterranea MF3/22]EJD08592.1 hypothetical protein FOMMEDRAFT_151475 [Fomitiporia mediterranea MF3/22]